MTISAKVKYESMPNLAIRRCIHCANNFPAKGKRLTCSTECSVKWQYSWKKRIKLLPGGAEKLKKQQQIQRSTPGAKEKQKTRDAARISNPEKLAKERKRWNDYDSRPDRIAKKKITDNLRNTSPEGRAKIRARNNRHRALIRGNGFEKYDAALIFRRDKFICQICGEKTNKNSSWPDPKMSTIDHIIPISCGGVDAPHNVQCAHLSCNRKKWAVPKGQMILVGFGL